MLNIDSDYTPIAILDSGAFSNVIKAYDNINNKTVAIKRTYKNSQQVSREYLILKELRDNKYICTLLDIFYTK